MNQDRTRELTPDEQRQTDGGFRPPANPTPDPMGGTMSDGNTMGQETATQTSMNDSPYEYPDGYTGPVPDSM